MRGQDDAAGLFLQHLHAVFCKGIQAVGIDDERPRISLHEFGDLRVQPLTHARPHAEGDAVRGEDVAVERLKSTQDAGRELPHRRRIERLIHDELGIAGPRTQTRPRRQKDGARVLRFRRKEARPSERPLVRVALPLGKEGGRIRVLPEFRTAGDGRNADVGHRHPAAHVGAVRHQKAVLHEPHRDRLVRPHARRKGDTVFGKAARQIGRDDVRSAPAELDELFRSPLRRAREPRPQNTVDNERIAAPRDDRHNFARKALFFRGAVGRKLLGKAQNGRIEAAFQQDARCHKAVAAVVPPTTDKENIGNAEPLHRRADSVRKGSTRPFHELRGGRTPLDRRALRLPHLLYRVGMLHTSSPSPSGLSSSGSSANAESAESTASRSKPLDRR